MSSPKFKVGDEVRCLSDTSEFINTGELLTISRVSPSVNPEDIYTYHFEGIAYVLFEREIELINAIDAKIAKLEQTLNELKEARREEQTNVKPKLVLSEGSLLGYSAIFELHDTRFICVDTLREIQEKLDNDAQKIRLATVYKDMDLGDYEVVVIETNLSTEISFVKKK